MSVRRRVHTPLLLQMDAVECGAACLGIVLGYYGRFVPLAELREQCGVSRDGSKASKMVQCARRYGLDAKGLSKSPESLPSLPLPLIVFWQFNHFVVVEGFSGKRVYLNDPAHGRRAVTLDEFNDGFTGVVLTLVPGNGFTKGGSWPRLLPAVVRRLRRHRLALLLCLLTGILLVLPRLALPVFSRIFVDDIVLEGRLSWYRPLLVVMALTLVLHVALKAVERLSLRRLYVALSAQLSGEFFWSVLRLPMAFYTQRFPGEIGYRGHLNPKVAEVLTGQLAGTAVQLVSLGFFVAVMVYYDAWLTAIGVCFAALNFVALRALAKQRVEANLRMAQDAGKAAAVALAGIQGIETIKASGMESGFFAKWAGHFTKASLAHQRLESSAAALGVLPMLLSGVTITLVLVAGGLRVIAGELTLGMLVAFQSLMQSFLEPIGQLVRLGSTLQVLEGDLLRLDDVVSTPVEKDLTGLTTASRLGDKGEIRLQGFVEVRGLTFGYTPLDPPLIQEFNLTTLPGMRVALVGGSGSGKSTISRLIAGLYRAWSGTIAFDGCRRQEIPRLRLDSSVSFVDQETMLFEGTVRDNLTLWDPTVSEQALQRACTDAAIYDTVMALPGGLDAMLREGGSNLSGGQRQRLEIARALVNNPSILILDEATSALDAETESVVDENLRRRGCTCIIVAHRLSTIRDCNEIIVLQNGQVVERGTHEELWAAGGHYVKLIQVERD